MHEFVIESTRCELSYYPNMHELTGKVQVTYLVIATTNIHWMSYWDYISNSKMGLYGELYFHYSWPLARLHVCALVTNWKDWNSPWYN